jgi:hypothetical protein
MDFLPEWRPETCGDIIHAVYRLYDNGPWHYVMDGSRRAMYPSLHEASKAARKLCSALGNSRIRSSLPAEESSPDMFGVEEWRKRKERGGPSAATVFSPGKKPFKVEIKGRKWRRSK